MEYNTPGEYSVTWIFTDAAGNSSNGTQIVIIKDTTPPVVPSLADVSEVCAVRLTAPTTTDNCSAVVTGTSSDPLEYNTPGEYSVTWIFTDAHGNSSTAVQNIEVDYLEERIDAQTACDSFTWIDGVTYTESTTTATHVTTDNEGCEILHRLDLEVTNIDPTVRLEDKTLVANQEGASYQWIDCDNGNTPIAGATQQRFSPTEDEGNYAVIIQLNGCEEQSVCTQVSKEETPIDSSGAIILKSYPNPTNGRVNLEANKPLNGIVRVVDITGRVLSSKIIDSQTTFFIDIEGVIGVYYIEVLTQEITKTIPVLKQ